jgi:hypothetical protein
MDESQDFYDAFFAGITQAGLELRDHWHPDDEESAIYKLRDPRSGKTMRFKVSYGDAVSREAGEKMADAAVSRFFNRDTTNASRPQR